MSERRVDEETEAGLDGLAELLYECGVPPQRAERIARDLYRRSNLEFGEDEN
ncbi:hypothetical protein [Lentzea sp. NBRC 102530]|uniref:hypothetical protein n=1 Tax=Lentzea sp. NBRC 102530 TaxID=3032201 RepID=UPI0024A3A648|nr:hypothetical protein [Lentzea sp. NBRC 102530]GLY55356.1 hypothetical protein Lesp01_90110 [Lentzea sp. NBRC 102530]